LYSLLNGAMLTGSVRHNFQNLRYFSVSGLKDWKVAKSKPTQKLKHANSILEYFEYFCQMSSESILTILSYTVSNLARFFWDTIYTVSQKKLCQCCFWNNSVKHWPTLIIFSVLHYLVKCRSRILAVYNNEFILVVHAVSENHCETTKLLKICYLLNINQEQVYHIKISVNKLKQRINSEWAALSHTVIECAVGAWHQGLCACVHADGGHFEHKL